MSTGLIASREQSVHHKEENAGKVNAACISLLCFCIAQIFLHDYNRRNKTSVGIQCALNALNHYAEKKKGQIYPWPLNDGK